MLNVTDCWITPALFDSRMEFAIRTWALTDKALAEVLKGVDEVRIQALTALFETYSFPALEARIRAQTVYLTQVGYIAMRTEETRALRLDRIPDYVFIFTGQAPTAVELARFRARHAG